MVCRQRNDGSDLRSAMDCRNQRNKKLLYVGFGCIAAFIVWTVLVCFVDIQPIGPNGSTVGFATLNRWVHNLTGVHMDLYILTDWLSLIPLVCIMGFAFLGLLQWIRRKSILKVDCNILFLGGFYIVVMAAFLLFEVLVVNYRPVLIEGILEASYPSSTTMLVMCVMPTTAMQARARIQNNAFKNCLFIFLMAFTVFMVVSRLLSGVHWFTDIIGGILLSAGLVTMYAVISGLSI